MKVDRTFLVKTLRDMAEHVERGDSFGGGIEYSCVDDDLGEGEFEMKCVYRVGNSNGQGEMRILK